MKIKRLPSAMRAKKRYVAFAVGCDEDLRRDEAVKIIWRSAMGFFGEKEMARINLRVLDFNEDSQEGILVCSHKAVGDAKVALALVSNTDGKKTCVLPLGVSGTLQALKRKFMGKRGRYENADGPVDHFGGLKLIRRRGKLLDALPMSRDLEARAKDLNVKFVGLMESENYIKSA